MNLGERQWLTGVFSREMSINKLLFGTVERKAVL